MMKNIRSMYVACLAATIILTSCNVTKKTSTNITQTTTTTEKQKIKLQAISQDLLNGEWLFLTALDQPVVGDEPVHINFNTHTKRVIGNNGCNIFNGRLELGNDNAMSFPDCVTTLMACRPDITDVNVMNALNATTHYNVTKNTDDELKMDLLDDNGKVVATISRQLRELLNGHWNIVEVDGKEVHIENMPSVVLDITSMKLTGNSGCNLMNGNIAYDATTINNGIRFENVVSTRRMCDPATMKVEANIIDALENVDAFRLLDNNRIALYTIPDTRNLLVLERK